MAYPTIDAPYGLRPIGMIGGHSYVGSTRKIPIASNYGTALFYGDVVQYKNDGTIIITTYKFIFFTNIYPCIKFAMLYYKLINYFF